LSAALRISATHGTMALNITKTRFIASINVVRVKNLHHVDNSSDAQALQAGFEEASRTPRNMGA